MQNIRRVVVDVRPEAASDALYLDLVNPPIIKRSNAREKSNIDDSPQRRFFSNDCKICVMCQMDNDQTRCMWNG